MEAYENFRGKEGRQIVENKMIKIIAAYTINIPQEMKLSEIAKQSNVG